MRRHKYLGWLFSQCDYCDVLFWIVLGALIGALLMVLACASIC